MNKQEILDYIRNVAQDENGSWSLDIMNAANNILENSKELILDRKDVRTYLATIENDDSIILHYEDAYGRKHKVLCSNYEFKYEYSSKYASEIYYCLQNHSSSADVKDSKYSTEEKVMEIEGFKSIYVNRGDKTTENGLLKNLWTFAYYLSECKEYYLIEEEVGLWRILPYRIDNQDEYFYNGLHKLENLPLLELAHEVNKILKYETQS